MRGCSFILLYSVCFLGISINTTLQQRSNTLSCDGEATLLSESLLQLGSGLKNEVVHTQESIASILKQMDIFNVSLGKLFREVFQTAQLGQDLDRKASRFIRNDTMYQKVAELNKEVSMIWIQGASLDSKIKPLEKKMQRAVNMTNRRDSFPNMSSILSSIESQKMQIEELMQVVDIHQDQINTQEAKIKSLLKKVGTRRVKNKDRQNEDVHKKS
ncbi:angiopoietin-related protein 3-like [Pelodytes ibericus]